MLDPDVLAYGCPLDNGRHDNQIGLSTPESLSNLRDLDKDMRRLLWSEYLDLSTLTLLRSVSRRLRLGIGGTSVCSTIITYAPSSIRAALSLEVAPLFSYRDLWTVLHNAECYHWGKFGAFLYLLTCQRLCYQ